MREWGDGAQKRKYKSEKNKKKKKRKGGTKGQERNSSISQKCQLPLCEIPTKSEGWTEEERREGRYTDSDRTITKS